VSGGVSKLLRGVAGVIVVIVLIFVVKGWYDQYSQAQVRSARAARASQVSQDATAALVPVSGPPQTASVLADGIPLSSQAATGSKTIRMLKKGETLLVVGVAGSWYQLRDSSGHFGYVNSVPGIKLIKQAAK
jgi:uncharacterized protein YgiM (DUF1202 family)